MTAFPWARAIGFGLGVLRLAPDAFWRMTPRELACALRAFDEPHLAPLDRSAFEALRARFPDTPHPEGAAKPPSRRMATNTDGLILRDAP